MDFFADEDELKKLFEDASAYARTMNARLTQEQMLALYARYKQALEGPCDAPKPGLFDFQGKHKWSAWKELGALERSEAMRQYIALIDHLDPDWQTKSGAAQAPAKGHMTGISVSRPLAATDLEPATPAHLKTLFDWVKEGALDQVQACVAAAPDAPALLAARDEQSTPVLHWAVDRDHRAVVAYLLAQGADVNAVDADGATALHLASTCAHLEVARLLVEGGADCSLRDQDGLTAAASSDDPCVQQLLQPLTSAS